MKVSVVAILFVASFTLFDFYFTNHASAVDAAGATATSSIISASDLAVINQIDSIQLDTSFFTSPIFASLIDTTVIIPTENAGKQNPFSPLPNSPTTPTAPTTPTNTKSTR